ncbi:hypothetical protein ANANG_G00075510 [Anguilla anguilla]|uniref:Secreted protein n=1 Tax=Anguilla anguilla TaxID=7936 RepID=A0A9D3MIZ9_ANGAN|nr:hypothetical protein ANANG_G00075510 [Anguilla anguilla]
MGVCVSVCACMCAGVCTCGCVCVPVCMRVCVCVCVRMRERECSVPLAVCGLVWDETCSMCVRLKVTEKWQANVTVHD